MSRTKYLDQSPGSTLSAAAAADVRRRDVTTSRFCDVITSRFFATNVALFPTPFISLLRIASKEIKRAKFLTNTSSQLTRIKSEIGR